MRSSLCVLIVVVALCNLSTASLSDTQTFDTVWAQLPIPWANSSFSPLGWQMGYLMGIDDQLFMTSSVEYLNGRNYVWQTYLYEFNLQLELTATLNLTSINPTSPIGSKYSFGNSNNKQLYLFSMGTGPSLFSVAQVDTTSMSVVTVKQFNGTVWSGFINYEGTEVIYVTQAGPKGVNALVLNATGLAMLGSFPLNPPQGDQWVSYPSCIASNNDPTVAYCSCELIKGNREAEYIFTLSLTNFRTTANIETSLFFMEVAYPGISSPADLFVLSNYPVGQNYFFNLTGYSSDLKQVWQVELPPNTDLVFGMVSVGNSVVVSISPKVFANVVMGYDSSTGQQNGQWNNTTPYPVSLPYVGVPPPIFESNAVWDLLSVDLASNGTAWLVDVQVTIN